LAVGRHAVRRILASICCSIKQLNAAAAPETNQMPKHASAARPTWTMVGTDGTAKTIPIKAQNTIN